MNNNINSVWVLTRVPNEYNQEGDDLVAVFKEKPKSDTIARYTGRTNEIHKKIYNEEVVRCISDNSDYRLSELKFNTEYVRMFD